MATIRTNKDIISLSSFRASYKEYISVLDSGHHPLVLTQNGKAAAVLLSPKEYDKLRYNQEILNLISSRLQEISDQKFIKDEEEMWKELGI